MEVSASTSQYRTMTRIMPSVAVCSARHLVAIGSKSPTRPATCMASPALKAAESIACFWAGGRQHVLRCGQSLGNSVLVHCHCRSSRFHSKPDTYHSIYDTKKQVGTTDFHSRGLMKRSNSERATRGTDGPETLMTSRP